METTVRTLGLPLTITGSVRHGALALLEPLATALYLVVRPALGIVDSEDSLDKVVAAPGGNNTGLFDVLVEISGILYNNVPENAAEKVALALKRQLENDRRWGIGTLEVKVVLNMLVTVKQTYPDSDS